ESALVITTAVPTAVAVGGTARVAILAATAAYGRVGVRQSGRRSPFRRFVRSGSARPGHDYPSAARATVSAVARTGDDRLPIGVIPLPGVATLGDHTENTASTTKSQPAQDGVRWATR